MTEAPIPLPQSPQFHRTAQILGVRTAWTLVPGGTCLVQERRLPGFGRLRLVSRGPVSDRALETSLAPVLRGPGPLILNAEHEAAGQMRGAGFYPILTPATLARVHLRDPVAMRSAMHQKWRNRLYRGEEAPVTVYYRPLPADPDHWLIRAEAAQQRRRGYRNLPGHWIAGYAAANPKDALLWEARQNGDLIAGVVILRHGTTATYQIGLSTDQGRRIEALRLLLWRAVCALWDDGCKWLELGPIDGKTAPGLARFKLGIGAEAVPLGGTWLYHRALAPLARRVPPALAA